tara:strand:- start:1443 stop:2366 length:924 start_codon:yes stop_codon:yes gene_type:complete
VLGVERELVRRWIHAPYRHFKDARWACHIQKLEIVKDEQSDLSGNWLGMNHWNNVLSAKCVLRETAKANKEHAMSPPFRTVFAIYDDMTHLDFTGPHQVLCRLPKSETLVASRDGGAVVAEGNLVIGRTQALSTIDRCDLLCVPGGVTATQWTLDDAFIKQVRRLGLQATYITSVCTGSLILGAAGLLQGKRAACHWAWRDLLAEFGAVIDDSRVVRDGNIITGGGVTAGIDFAFTMVAEIAGEAYAKALTLGYEYAPSPPFAGGRPELAEPDILEVYHARMKGLMDARRAEAVEAGARMRAQAGRP